MSWGSEMQQKEMTMTNAKQSGQGKYATIAVLVLNTIVVFVILNCALFAAFKIKDRYFDGPVRADTPVNPQRGDLFNPDGSPQVNERRNIYQLKWFDFNAYENIPAQYVSHVLDDFDALARRGFVYQPWVEFSEPAYHGQLVNIDIDPRGIPSRRTTNPPNAENLPVVNVVTLGGSTTFGYDVSDEHTWPSYLATVLNEKARADGTPVHVQVTNYGRAYFNPSQESILMVDLLRSGLRPSLVIFMDGVNFNGLQECYDQDTPRFSQAISQQVKNLQFKDETLFIQRLDWLPMIRLADFIKRRLTRLPSVEADTGNAPNLHRVDQIVNSFVQNQGISSAVCKYYGCETLFFLQPSALYNYRLDLFRRPVPEEFLSLRNVATEFYERLRSDRQRIYMGDMFEAWGSNRKAIVDDVHYSPGFNLFLAKEVTKYIDLKALKTRTALIDDAAATGLPRTFVPQPR